MGQNQSVAGTGWSIDDFAYGTGANAVSIDAVIAQTGTLPTRLFGGEAIQNDATMHQMQHDLLAIDDTLKRIFLRRKKTKRSAQDRPEDEYYPEEESAAVQQSTDSRSNEDHYLVPTFIDVNQTVPSHVLESIPDSLSNAAKNFNNKILWRCTQCTAENKITERVCRRCRQCETAL